jgi:outer membrane receptor for ferrienterochelin and colicin
MGLACGCYDRDHTTVRFVLLEQFLGCPRFANRHPARLGPGVAIMLWFVLALAPRPAHGQTPPPTGKLTGTVTTQASTTPVRLPGALITVTDPAGRVAAEITADERGAFTTALSPGQYTVTASLTGFVTATAKATVAVGGTATVALDLDIAGLAQTVDVVAENPTAGSEETIALTQQLSSNELDQFSPRGALQALRLLSSVIHVGGGDSIKGGRPSQTSVQLGSSAIVDPVTGLSPLALPSDAIDSISVLPNPYAVEYGRFSSGLILIRTRRAGDSWKLRLNDFDPTFRTTRTSPLHPIGIGWWGPRLETGGPIVKRRLFLEQTAQFRYTVSDVPSLPQSETRTSRSFSSFTRVDGTLSPRHSFVASGGVFPDHADDATLGTFTPPDATVNLRADANQAAFTERDTWSDTLSSETTIQAHHYQTDVLPQGTAPMELRPETTLGNFFNRQSRQTGTLQLVSSLSGTHNGVGGIHLFKVGLDAMHSIYDGMSVSQPVLIERGDGTLARRLAFSPVPTLQHVRTTDLAIFVQDRFQPATRWYTEFGWRLDRDGVTDRVNVTPRVGGAVLLNRSGTSMIRGGFGLFYERTPSIVQAFDGFESYVETRYAADGVTPLGPPVAVVSRAAPDLRTARARTWNLAYEYQRDRHWSFHVSGLIRSGSHELVVDPVQLGPTEGALQLDSRGHSSYRGVEFGVDFTADPKLDFHATYTRATAHADLNALTNYFDTILNPVTGVNQYAAAPTDVPNRLLARGRYMPTDRWFLLGVADWRDGLPYSIVDGNREYVGTRNTQRFPEYFHLEIGVERRFNILGLQPWIGVRIWNALNAFLPVDVQANLTSPAFGSFYNSEYRQVRIEIRFAR